MTSPQKMKIPPLAQLAGDPLFRSAMEQVRDMKPLTLGDIARAESVLMEAAASAADLKTIKAKIASGPKPEPLRIPDGTNELEAMRMAEQYQREHANWTPPKRAVTRDPAPTLQAIRTAATRQMVERLTPAKRPAKRATVDANQPFSKMNREEYALAAKRLKEVGVDLATLCAADLDPRARLTEPVVVAEKPKLRLVEQQQQDAEMAEAEALNEMNREPRWRLRSTLGGYEVFVKDGPYMRITDKRVATAVFAFFTGNLCEMLTERQVVNEHLPKAP